MSAEQQIAPEACAEAEQNVLQLAKAWAKVVFADDENEPGEVAVAATSALYEGVVKLHLAELRKENHG